MDTPDAVIGTEGLTEFYGVSRGIEDVSLEVVQGGLMACDDARTLVRDGREWEGSAMIGKPGDRIVIEGSEVGHVPREGEILQVKELDPGVEYRVRWQDGHESMFIPAAGAARIVPATRRR